MAMETAPPPHRTREALAFRIRTALRLERTPDLLEAVNMMVEDYGEELMGEEPDLILSAFTGAYLEKKSLLQKITDIECENDSAKYTDEMALFRAAVKCEMADVCYKWMQVIEDYLVPSCTAAEQRVFLLKMIGDISWLQVPLVNEDNKQQLCDKTVLSYQKGIAESQGMIESDPLKLSIKLNLSLFYHDELGDMNRALLLANQTIARATQSLSFLDKSSATLSKQILNLIKEHMMHWAMSRAIKDKHEEEEENQQNCKEEEDVEEQHFQAEAEDDHHVPNEAEAVVQPEHHNVWKTPYSTRSPSPVRRRTVPVVPRLTFEDPPSYGPEDAASDKQIRKLMKLAQAKRGAMG